MGIACDLVPDRHVLAGAGLCIPQLRRGDFHRVPAGGKRIKGIGLRHFLCVKNFVKLHSLVSFNWMEKVGRPGLVVTANSSGRVIESSQAFQALALISGFQRNRLAR